MDDNGNYFKQTAPTEQNINPNASRTGNTITNMGSSNDR